ncbi:splicing factor ESS-2 homolog isoform X2 [Chrysoperla carnea]|uniref:splicing factor ESS-2 homolog isoform X2 n=1 Tax=Chrysoperla carnea TaxID=189513 RepID=UPI001D066DBA|nr:splicing factor ESS-2 homolog isoform X2 [Chrysoperla carnea]
MSKEKDKLVNTPGHKALQTMESLNKELVFKVPKVPARKTTTKILDEESYIEEMGKIIERDFFPDLEKLKAQNDYLDALERNDRDKLREIFAKYSEGRLPHTEPRLASPATFETPANLHNEPTLTPDISKRTSTTPPREDDLESNSDIKKSKISLDSYLATHTSEDNKSFTEIMEETEQKHRIKYSYLYNEETKNLSLALPSIEQQAQITERPFNVDGWNYKNKNYIMYVPDGVELTKQELIEMSKKRKEIVHGNTRLQANPFDEEQSKETISELAKSQAKILDGRIGVDGKELIQSETPQVLGFSLVRTPSPCPGVAESPLMTWGQIEGTPFRLDGSDTPLTRSQGPSFKIADLPKREKLALALAEKVGERHRDRKQKAIQAARRQLATPSSLRRLETMSPAARRLAASSRLGDLALRASYSPSPLLSGTRGTTSRLTSSSAHSNLVRTPRSNNRPATPKTPRSVGVTLNKNLTDNLLHISVAKRAKASDFF